MQKLRDFQFDLVLRGGYQSAKPLERDLVEQQELIRWCEHLVEATPNRWWSAPALLKSDIDRVFVRGRAKRLPRPVPVRQATREGPVGAFALHAECTLARRLALPLRIVRAMDLGSGSPALRVPSGPLPRTLRREGRYPRAPGGILLGFYQSVRLAWGVSLATVATSEFQTRAMRHLEAASARRTDAR